MSEERRDTFYRKVGEGLARFVADNPKANLATDTPGITRAEEALNLEGTAYLAGCSSLERVRDRFTTWKSEVLANV